MCSILFQLSLARGKAKLIHESIFHIYFFFNSVRSMSHNDLFNSFSGMTGKRGQDALDSFSSFTGTLTALTIINTYIYVIRQMCIVTVQASAIQFWIPSPRLLVSGQLPRPSSLSPPLPGSAPTLSSTPSAASPARGPTPTSWTLSVVSLARGTSTAWTPLAASLGREARAGAASPSPSPTFTRRRAAARSSAGTPWTWDCLAPSTPSEKMVNGFDNVNIYFHKC